MRGYAGRADFCPFAPIDPAQPDSLSSYVRERLQPEGLEDGTALALAIVPGGVSRLVGTITLTLDPFPIPVGRLECTLDPDYRGKGYMTEALQAVLPTAIREMGVLRLCAEADAENQACCNLLERIGLERIKTLSKTRKLRGELRDGILYAIDLKSPEH